jgi:hypothetical protein
MKTIGGRFRAAMLMGAAASVLLFAGGAKAQDFTNNQWPWGNPSPNDNTWPYAKTGGSPVLAVVGDIACQPGDEPSGEKVGENCSGDTKQNLYQSQAATASQIEAMKPDLIALVGDEQYQVGQYSDFENSYELSYGAFKFITRPAPGNHEFYNEHGAIGVAGYGYFSYFNGVQHIPTGPNAGAVQMTTIDNPITGTFTQPVPFSDGQAGHFDQSGGLGTAVEGTVGVGDGWYSYNLGSWHIISLNIECETQPGGCSDASGTWFAQETEWLKNDLAANHSACTLAYWHQPTFSATDGLSLEGITAGTWWQLLYQYGADLVLNGHDHLYARFAPVAPSFDSKLTDPSTGITGIWTGSPDADKGIREFIVGTGGETLDPIVAGSADYQQTFTAKNLESGTGSYWGVMALTLDQNGYKWDYESVLKDPAQKSGPPTFSDKGSAMCHGGTSWDGNNQ